MRRTALFAPMISLLLLLSACGRDSLGEWQRWQEEQQGAAEIRFTAEICSLSDTEAIHFSAQVVGQGERVTMTLTQPETLRGLRVITAREGRSLGVEEMEFSLTAGRPQVLSPSEAGAILLAALREGHILYTASDGDGERAAFTGPRDETVSLWRGPDGEPIAAEIARGESAELRLRLSDWQSKE